MKFFKKAIITVLILALILVGPGVKTFYDAGEFKEITPHSVFVVNHRRDGHFVESGILLIWPSWEQKKSLRLSASRRKKD
jgi:hypothetical protein